MDPFVISVLSNMALFSFLALSAWVLLLSGEISFGQQAYFAIGAYTGGIATAVWGLPFGLALVIAVLAGMAVAALVAWPASRLGGMHYAIASLAFAELVRSVLNVFRYQREVDGYAVGPDGADGFRDIRWAYEAGLEASDYLALIAACLTAVLVGLSLAARARLLPQLRMIGEDPILAGMQGLNVLRWKIGASAAAGGIAALGGVLYAHLATYLEPALFSVMTGVHAVAYGLIGGLGSVFGPLLGVAIDIGLLESLRSLSAYRMIVFGGVVALILILRPRGILDEKLVARVASWARR